ncbi:MAG: NCS1 family nucleobase:cation symporter-1 [Cyanobacteria bacterium REEB67]|nr:NCS1 family nucleobase:cation symporter-1 [Cyanobacteria bacterium REEB67]
MAVEDSNREEELGASGTACTVHADGRVELTSTYAIEASPIYNHDLAPVAVSARNWTTYNYVALWFAMSACIPTYMMSSGLIASGMNAMQAVFTIMLGNTIVLIPILLNSHPGTKYGIPFPVFARAAYGTVGSNLPALMRAVVACGWFGIQAWIGGQALNTMFLALWPAWKLLFGGPYGGYMGCEWFSFALFWAFNIFIVYRGMDLLKKVEGLAAPFVLFMTVALFLWAINQAHGVGDLMHQKSKFKTLSEFFVVFVPSLTGMIGFWATLSLNMPDFTRFGRSQKEQTVGQIIALPTAMALFATMGVVITSCAVVIYPDVPLSSLWDPIKLIGRFNDPAVVVVAMFTVALATLSVNVAANVVSPANDFANALPRFISFKTGGLITGIVGVIMQPWRLIADPSGYIFVWLQGYSGGLGAIAGVLIADYWLIRKKELALADLYLLGGRYKYQNGWNYKAVVATIAGCFWAWIGAFVPALKGFYDYGWFVGFGVSLITYCALMRQPK